MIRLIVKAMLIIALTTSQALAGAICDTPIVWGWNDYKPYSYRATTEQLVGLDIDLTRVILQGADCAYETQEIPARRALKMLEAGEIDLVAAASMTPDRENYGYFSVPYRNERIVMFARRDDKAAATIKSFGDVATGHLRVAAGDGGSYGSDYDTSRHQLQAAGLLTLNASLEQRLQLLAGHRVDLVIEDEVAGASTARALGLADRLQVVGPPLNDQPVRLLFSRKSVRPALISAINDTIDRLRSSPAYAAILARYSSLGQ